MYDSRRRAARESRDDGKNKDTTRDEQTECRRTTRTTFFPRRHGSRERHDATMYISTPKRGPPPSDRPPNDTAPAAEERHPSERQSVTARRTLLPAPRTLVERGYSRGAAGHSPTFRPAPAISSTGRLAAPGPSRARFRELLPGGMYGYPLDLCPGLLLLPTPRRQRRRRRRAARRRHHRR